MLLDFLTIYPQNLPVNRHVVGRLFLIHGVTENSMTPFTLQQINFTNRSFISGVRPTVQTNLSGKLCFLKALLHALQIGGISKHWLFVLVWTKNSLKLIDLFKNGDILIILSFSSPCFLQTDKSKMIGDCSIL